MNISSNTYDFLKKHMLAILTGGATLIIAIGKIWNIPYTEAIAATLTAIARFIVYVINNSSKEFFKDKEIVEKGIVDYNEGGQG